MSESRRTNITISQSLYEKALENMRVRDFSDFSGYVQQLIREDWAHRELVMSMRDKPQQPPMPPAQPVTYRGKRKRHRAADETKPSATIIQASTSTKKKK